MKKHFKILSCIIAIVLTIAFTNTAFAVSPREWSIFSITKQGQTNYRTTLVQRILYELPGYLTELTDVDAVFGPNTTTQVKNFQGNHGRTRDGIVGTNTWTDLEGKIKYSRFNGYGTGIYCVIYKVNGTECIKMWNMSQETNYKYDWEVLDRMGTYREVQTLLSDRLIMT